MVERGDLLALHEPIEGLLYFGDTEVEGRTFSSPESLLRWLCDETHAVSLFLKETTDYRVREVVLADPRFLAEGRHAFLVRRPDEIAASLYALKPDMRIDEIGLEALHELHTAVHDAGGHRPWSSTPTTSWHGPRPRWRRTAPPSSCHSYRRRSRGSPASGPSGGGRHAGTRTSVPAPVSSSTPAQVRAQR